METKSNSEKVEGDPEAAMATCKLDSEVPDEGLLKRWEKLIFVPISIIVAITLVCLTAFCAKLYLDAEQSLLDRYVDRYTACAIMLSLSASTGAVAVAIPFQSRKGRLSAWGLFFWALQLTCIIIEGFCFATGDDDFKDKTKFKIKTEANSTSFEIKFMMWCVGLQLVAVLLRLPEALRYVRCMTNPEYSTNITPVSVNEP